MRIKNFTLLFLMGIFGLFSFTAQAQQDVTIDPADIRYWIGEGTKEAVFIVNWNEPDTALAWGYRFNGDNVTMQDMMDEIAATDTRFSYTVSGPGWLADLKFDNGELNLALAGMWWTYLLNGQTSFNLFNEQVINDGDYVKWGDESCGILVDPVNYVYVWTKEVAPVYPLAYEATIDPSEILYWVGEGDNQVVFAVNWADPNICYAWGYRFSTENVLVKTIMDDIAAADYRVSYVTGGWGVSDIKFDTETLQLALVGMYWMYNINGSMAMLGYDQQTVVNGDFIKWGDESCGTEIAPWTLVWETPVQPVPDNTGVNENTSEFTLCPNPASSYTMLNIQNMEYAVVTITDLQGRVLSSFGVTPNSEAVRIETSGYQAGIYFVTVNGANSRQTVKLSVQ